MGQLLLTHFWEVLLTLGYMYIHFQVILVRFLRPSMLSKVHVVARLHTLIRKTCRPSISTHADFN